MKTVAQLMQAAFPPERPARSAEYRDGVKQTLQSRLEGWRTQCPYPEGSVECDAWASGTEEGHLIYRIEQKRTRAGANK